jgi:hypothetical protein
MAEEDKTPSVDFDRIQELYPGSTCEVVTFDIKALELIAEEQLEKLWKDHESGR